MAFIKYIPLLLITTSAQAQSFSFSDLFGQASKQKNYYLQQIAAYNTLRAELNQGYNVMKHGLGSISDFKTAELHAHTAYYAALKTPSASVKSNTQVKAIVAYQSYINAAFSQNFTGLTSAESTYVRSVRTSVFAACEKDITNLENLLVTGKLQMSDDERLKRLNAIHAAMLDKYEFSQSFTHSLKILAIRRQQEEQDAQTLTLLYANH